MLNFILKYYPPLMWFIVTVEAALTFRLFQEAVLRRAARDHALASHISLLSGLAALGLLTDALVIACGAFLPVMALAPLSRVRLLARALLLPLLFPVCGYALRLKKNIMLSVWTFTVALLAAGTVSAVLTVLEPNYIAGIIRFTSAPSTAKLADAISTMVTNAAMLALVLVGAVVWGKYRTPYLFLGGVVLTVFTALGSVTGMPYLSFFFRMVGEMGVVIFLYLYCRFAPPAKAEAPAAPADAGNAATQA